MNICFNPALARSAAHAVTTEKTYIFARHVQGKRRATEQVALNSYQFGSSQVRLSDSPRSIESDIPDRRKVVQIRVALDRRFQFAEPLEIVGRRFSCANRASAVRAIPATASGFAVFADRFLSCFVHIGGTNRAPNARF